MSSPIELCEWGKETYLFVSKILPPPSRALKCGRNARRNEYRSELIEETIHSGRLSWDKRGVADESLADWVLAVNSATA